MLHRSANAIMALLALGPLPAIVNGGTLDQIKKAGEIRLGYRTDAPPLAVKDSSGQPSGDSVELCQRVAAAVKDQLKLNELKTTFVPLTSENRLDAIVGNRVDIECGATTMTLTRAQKVDFSLMTFVTGGRDSVARGHRNRFTCESRRQVRRGRGGYHDGAGTEELSAEESDRREGGRRRRPRRSDEAVAREAGGCICFRSDRADWRGRAIGGP